MRWIFGDAETFYSKEYSLRKMTPVEYILDPRYETIGWAVCDGDKKSTWMPRDKFADCLRVHGNDFAFVSHNALFDACILAFRYGIYPKLCVDTMSMARALLMHKLPGGRVSLDNVGGYLGIGKKGSALASVLGMTYDEIERSGRMRGLVEYALNDVEMCRGIYKQLAPQFPPQEFVINHMVIEMATRPQFTIDQEKLHEHLGQILADKESLLDRVGLTREDLSSNDKFAEALRSLGVEPRTKTSLTTGQPIYAFAKTDEFMDELEEHPDPDVQALAAARTGIKSTLEESRTQRFINIAQVTHDGNNSWMPIPLRFSGAHTHRFSGDWKLNAQNLPSRKNKKLRQALKAPEGHVVLTCDASQIEARLNAWLCGQRNLLDIFETGGDPYGAFATDIYGVKVIKGDKTTGHMRLGGKIAILGLGFGMGRDKFQATWRIQSADAGTPMFLEIEEAARIVNLYRSKYARIKAQWKIFTDMIPEIANGQAEGKTFGPCVFEKGAILLPSGMRLFYEDLRYETNKEGKKEWRFTYAGKRKKLYGGLTLENIVQSLDRICVIDAAVRVRARFRSANFINQALHAEWVMDGLRLAHQVHDENVYVVPLEAVEEAKAIVLEEMRRRPAWGPDLPLDAEAGVGPTFGDAK